MSTLIHAADIGNGATNFETYMMWSALVMQEFNYQFEREQNRNFPSTKMFQYKGEMQFFKGQINFLGIIVIRTFRVSSNGKNLFQIP